MNYARGDIDPEFATKYRLPIPQHAPFAIGYTFESKPHHYLPDAVGTLANGKPFIYPWVSAWRDGAEAKLHGEVFRRFIRGWLQTGVDRRRIKEV